MLHVLFVGVAMGLVATIAIDVWAVILWKAFGQPAPNWAGPGRWVWHLKDGKVFHDSIGNAAPHPNEQAIGWIFHYVVGIAYGVMLALFMGPAWLAAPTLLPALIWGIVTIAAGWFLLQPGLGIGWAAAKTPNPNKVRILGLVAHAIFGVALWATAVALA